MSSNFFRSCSIFFVTITGEYVIHKLGVSVCCNQGSLLLCPLIWYNDTQLFCVFEKKHQHITYGHWDQGVLGGACNAFCSLRKTVSLQLPFIAPAHHINSTSIWTDEATKPDTDHVAELLYADQNWQQNPRQFHLLLIRWSLLDGGTTVIWSFGSYIDMTTAS